MSALEEFPGDLTLYQSTNGKTWILQIDSADLWGEVCSSSRDFLLAIADCYAAMRRDERAASPRAGAPCPAPAAPAGRAPLPPMETRPATPGGRQ